MKKTLLVFLFLTSFLYGFEVYVNSGVKNSRPITVLHLKNPTNFVCLTKVENATKYYECTVKGKSKLIANQSLKEFDLVFVNHKDKLVINIYPKVKSHIFSSDNILYENTKFLPELLSSSKHFLVVFDENAKLEQERYNGLDFNMVFDKNPLPYIGALDLDQNPVSFSKSNDVNAFIEIKRAYDNQRYLEAIEDIQKAMNKYPESIFTKDFIMYLLRSELELSSRTSEYLPHIINSAKQYIREYPSDSNYTEVLSILVKAYLKIEQKSDAEYFLDILSTEHGNDYFSKIAKLDYADYLAVTNRSEEALKLYNEILFSTNNTLLVSRSATALARININNNKLNLAKEYIQKVLSLNKEYLLQNTEQSFKIANDFFKAGFYDISVVIYQEIFDNSSKADSYYEMVLLNLAKSYFYAKDDKNAKKYLKEYQLQFPNGDYLTEIEQMLDSLYFNNENADPNELHNYYQMLMEKYDNEISKRALEEEVKLLYKEKQYSKVLDYTDYINEHEQTPAKDYLYKSAVYLINEDLDNQNCHLALKLSKQYKIDDKDIKDNKAMLSCYMRTQNYNDAIGFIERHFEEDIVFYKLNELKVLYLLGKYNEIIKEIKKIENDRFMFEKYELFDLYYYKSLAFLHLDMYNDAIFALKRLEKSSNEFRIVEVYDDFLDYFIKHDMVDSVINYGTKSVDLQNKIGVNLYSPKHEFILLWAMMQKEDYKNAREILNDLFKLELEADDYTKAKYLSGEIYELLKDYENAKKEYKECKSGGYKSLCDEKLNLLKD